MFQCKDLLSLTTMSQAKVIAGLAGMEKGIRWSYKAENINFEKWVNITVQMYPCSEGTDTGSPAL